MKLSRVEDHWVVASDYSERAIPKAAGCRWDPANKQWWTDRASVAAKLAQYADDSARGELERVTQARSDAIEASRAAEATVDIPAPEGLAYLPFQRAGISYITARPHTLVGDQMGLGKTIQSIGACNVLRPSNVLIICPASLKLNWAREWARWSTLDLTVGVANGSWPDTSVVVVNYDMIAKSRAGIDARHWDVLICDESHYLKSHKAARTIAVLGYKDKPGIVATHKLFLTGTPILNRPIELWPIVHAIDAENLGRSWKYYVTRYCAGHEGRYGWDVSGASNLDELQDALRASIMLRRLKADVLTELPAKRRALVVIDGDHPAVRAEHEAWERQEAALIALRAHMAAASDEAEYDAVAERFRSATTQAFAELAQARHDTAIAKIPHVIEHCAGVLDGSEDKIVVFAHHHDVIDALRDGLSGFNPVVLDGRVTDLAKRQEAVDRFQSDPTCRVFIGSIQAAGVGITLTASSHVVFAELDWVPANLTQAEDRTHRIGQADSVLVEHLVLQGSLDQRMVDLILSKQAITDAALDTISQGRDDSLPAIPTVGGMEIQRTYTPVDPGLHPLILDGLRMIASVCDGATRVDGAGFSKMDAAIGHKLAALSALTPRQAAVGFKLCNKYRRQIPGIHARLEASS